MDCERIQRLISLYLAGDIAGDDLEALMAHLSSCVKCRAAFEEAKRYEAALKGVFRESIAKSRSPKSRVLRKIEAQGPHGRRGKSLANWFIFIVLMAALCFLIVPNPPGCLAKRGCGVVLLLGMSVGVVTQIHSQESSQARVLVGSLHHVTRHSGLRRLRAGFGRIGFLSAPPDPRVESPGKVL